MRRWLLLLAALAAVALAGCGSGHAPQFKTRPVIRPATVGRFGQFTTSAPYVGETVTVSTGGQFSPPAVVTYQWRDCDSSGNNCVNAVGSSTGNSYLITSADVADNLSVAVTATNGSGSTTAYSAVSGTITGSSGAGCTSTLGTGGDWATAIASLTAGQALCLANGTYPGETLSAFTPAGYVTVEPSSGATATITTGNTINNSQYLNFQGLDFMGAGEDGGVALSFGGSSTGDSNLEIQNDIIENWGGGIELGTGSSQNVDTVLITNDTLGNFTFSAETPGPAVGQAVTCYQCNSGTVTVSHSYFYGASWHFIQAGTVSDLIVDHNLFTCPCEEHADAHLNVEQIFQGGTGDQFTNNEVIGDPNAGVGDDTNTEMCGGCVIFENGSGGQTCTDTYTSPLISNNLLVDPGGSFPISLGLSSGATVTYKHGRGRPVRERDGCGILAGLQLR